jgi:hypothetical protein
MNKLKATALVVIFALFWVVEIGLMLHGLYHRAWYGLALLGIFAAGFIALCVTLRRRGGRGSVSIARDV